MAKNLVIVESPAKAKTIKKFLGSNYEVIASNGHIRDLPKSTLGVDIENDFEPKYITIRGKGELLAKLKKEAQKANVRIRRHTGDSSSDSPVKRSSARLPSLTEAAQAYIEANKLSPNYMDTATATEYVTQYEADFMAENGIQ